MEIHTETKQQQKTMKPSSFRNGASEFLQGICCLEGGLPLHGGSGPRMAAEAASWLQGSESVTGGCCTGRRCSHLHELPTSWSAQQILAAQQCIGKQVLKKINKPFQRKHCQQIKSNAPEIRGCVIF